MKELEIELDTAVRENVRIVVVDMCLQSTSALILQESGKIQLGLLEAKMESQQRKLEATLAVEMEQKLSAKAEEMHQKLCDAETRLNEKHRAQMSELNTKHIR